MKARLLRASERLSIRGTAFLIGSIALLGVLGTIVVAVRVGRGRPHPAAPVTAMVRPAVDAEGQVSLEALLDRLEHGRSCAERRSAALALLARGDRRALEPLEHARRRAAGRRAPNGCMLHDLDEAIQRLRQGATEPAPAPGAPG